MLADADVLRKPGSRRARRARRSSRCASSDDGEVCVRSAFLMDGYFEHPDATAERAARRLVPHRRPRRARRRGLPLDRRAGPRRAAHRRRDASRRPRSRRCSPTHPDVAEVAVVGMPDTEWGEVISAVVVPRAGAPRPDARSAARALRRPPRARSSSRAGSRWSTQLPRTAATGQVQRTLLVERMTTRDRAS